MTDKHNYLSCLTNSKYPPLITKSDAFQFFMFRLNGNPICTNANALNIAQFCGTVNGEDDLPGGTENTNNITCLSQSCPLNDYFEYIDDSPVSCYCAAPFGVGFRLRSPSMSDFPPYIDQFKQYITSNLGLISYQLRIDSFIWQKGPRLSMYLKFFPKYNNQSNTFNTSEIRRIRDLIATFTIPGDDIFGPYDLLNFTLVGPYDDGMPLTLYFYVCDC